MSTYHRSPSNRGQSLRSLSPSERADLVQKHDVIDREEAHAKFPGTKRFICVGCKFADNDPTKAKNHREWVRAKFEEDAKNNSQGPVEEVA